MVRSLFVVFLVTFTIINQICPSARGDSHRHGQRNINSNTNINANINAGHRKYRRASTLPTDLGKDAAEKIVETAAVAAADAAKIVTRSLAKKLSENTADAVADAVVRVLASNSSKPAQKVMKVAARAAVAAARRNFNANSNTNVNVMARQDSSLESLEDDDEIHTRSDMNATARELDYAEEGHERINDDDLGADEDDDALENEAANINMNNNFNIKRMTRRFYGDPWTSGIKYARRSSLQTKTGLPRGAALYRLI